METAVSNFYEGKKTRPSGELFTFIKIKKKKKKKKLH
jgi:hypothetical protein